MGYKVTCLVVVLSIVSLSCRNELSEIYVSATGKTAGTGAVDSPLPDLGSAIGKALRIRTTDRNTAISIIVQPGDYYLSSPVVITPELSNLIIRGNGQGEVKIKGSAILNLSWKRFNEKIFVSDISDSLLFDQLVMNGTMQTLARYPNYNENGGHWQGHSADAFSPERVKSWTHPEGAIIHAMHLHEWGDFHYILKAVINDSLVLDGGHQNNRPAPMHPEYRMVENVFEELDAPEEWFLDKTEHKLFYYPAPEVQIETAVFEGVILKELLEIRGSEKNPVHDVEIKGLTLEYSRRTFMEPYEPLLRSDWTIYRGGSLFITGAENCRVSDCEFINLGGNAVFISGYNRAVEISGNHIHECGASGICFVGEPSAVRSPSFQYDRFVSFPQMDTIPGPKNDLYPKGCIASENLIYRTGRIEKQTAGIEISMSMDITLSHNTIYDVPRAGINIGDGTWGGHIIEFNDVFNTVLESGDHGSFNSWGRDRYWHPDRKTMDSLNLNNPRLVKLDAIHTTIIRNNRFRCDHGWDIDLDDGSSNYLICNNLCLNGGLKLREGFNRTAENNIMINNGFHPHVWFKNSNDIFRKNIMMAAHADILLQSWGMEVDYNLFPDEGSLMKSRQNEVDLHSRYGDPLFTDAVGGDFRVKQGSPAITVGFVNFPMDHFGVQVEGLKTLAKTPQFQRSGNDSK